MIHDSISRRTMILAGGAAALAPVVLTGIKRSEAQSTQLSASDRAVSAISGLDPGFGSAVEALYPGLTKDPIFQKIAPLAMLVTHQQGPPVRAFCVSWAITTTAGTYEAPLYFYVSLGSPATGHTLSALGSARKNILPAGQSRLVTPFFNWTPAFYRTNPAPNWKTVLKPTEPAVFLISELPKATQVKVSLDGVVFSDWKLMGPDKHALGWKIRSRRNAEHDEGLVVYKLMKSGAPDSQIIETLQEHGSAPRSNDKDHRWYQQARKVHAQILLRAFQDSDRHTFKRALVRLKMRRKTEITRLGV
jgi:hypothetical protein